MGRRAAAATMGRHRLRTTVSSTVAELLTAHAGVLSITVQLLHPEGGRPRRAQSARQLRTARALQHVRRALTPSPGQGEGEGGREKGRQSGAAQLALACSPADLRLVLEGQHRMFRASASTAELAELVFDLQQHTSKRGPSSITAAEDLDEVLCTCAKHRWIPHDVRAWLHREYGLEPRRLHQIFLGGKNCFDALSEQVTLGEQGVRNGATVQVVVAPAPPGSDRSSGAVVHHRRAIGSVRPSSSERRRQEATLQKLQQQSQLHITRGEWELAVGLLSQGITMAVRKTALQDMLSKRGLCRARMGDLHRAWHDHDAALGQAVSVQACTLHRYNRGRCALRLGMLEEAEADFNFACVHGLADSVVSEGARLELTKLGPMLRCCFEQMLAAVGTIFPTLTQLPCARSTEAFRRLCSQQRRERVNARSRGAAASSEGNATSEFEAVREAALATLAHQGELDPARLASGAMLAFSREAKRVTAAAIAAEGRQALATTPANATATAEHSAFGTGAPLEEGQEEALVIETVREAEERQAAERERARLQRRARMQGRRQDGMCWVRERAEIFAIAHRGGKRLETPPGAGAEAGAGAGRPARPQTAPVGRTAHTTSPSSTSLADIGAQVAAPRARQRPASAVQWARPRSSGRDAPSGGAEAQRRRRQQQQQQQQQHRPRQGREERLARCRRESRRRAASFQRAAMNVQLFSEGVRGRGHQRGDRMLSSSRSTLATCRVGAWGSGVSSLVQR
jgi:hypothetical protein